MTTASTATSIAFGLGIYATIVSTLVALLAFYGEIFQRVQVVAREAFLVPRVGATPLVVVGADALDAIGAPVAAARPIVTIDIRNRGRRPVQIRTVSKAGTGQRRRGFHVLDELFPALPFTLEPGHMRNLTLGAEGAPYTPGELGKISRFFVLDGAGRIHPLRERWRQAPGRAIRRIRRLRSEPARQPAELDAGE